MQSTLIVAVPPKQPVLCTMSCQQTLKLKWQSLPAVSHQDQHAYAKKHFKNPLVDIRLQDYRSMTGQKFDRIYSAPWKASQSPTVLSVFPVDMR